MVKLNFNIKVPGNIKDVYNYVGNFANISKWDPGCLSSELISD